MHNTGSCEQDVKNRIKTAWQKWRDLTGGICDPKITVALKRKNTGRYKKNFKNRIKTAWQKWRDLTGVICDPKITVAFKRKIYKTMIRPVPVMMYEARLRWYGHVERSGDTNIRRTMKLEVQGLRSRGRQKKRWMDMIQEDLKFLNPKPDDTGRRDMWRQRIRVADPSPAGD